MTIDNYIIDFNLFLMLVRPLSLYKKTQYFYNWTNCKMDLKKKNIYSVTLKSGG